MKFIWGELNQMIEVLWNYNDLFDLLILLIKTESKEIYISNKQLGCLNKRKVINFCTCHTSNEIQLKMIY